MLYEIPISLSELIQLFSVGTKQWPDFLLTWENQQETKGLVGNPSIKAASSVGLSYLHRNRLSHIYDVLLLSYLASLFVCLFDLIID